MLNFFSFRLVLVRCYHKYNFECLKCLIKSNSIICFLLFAFILGSTAMRPHLKSYIWFVRHSWGPSHCRIYDTFWIIYLMGSKAHTVWQLSSEICDLLKTYIKIISEILNFYELIISFTLVSWVCIKKCIYKRRLSLINILLSCAH